MAIGFLSLVSKKEGLGACASVNLWWAAGLGGGLTQWTAACCRTCTFQCVGRTGPTSSETTSREVMDSASARTTTSETCWYQACTAGRAIASSTTSSTTSSKTKEPRSGKACTAGSVWSCSACTTSNVLLCHSAGCCADATWWYSTASV